MTTFTRDYARRLTHDERLARADDMAEREATVLVRLTVPTLGLLLAAALLLGAWIGAHDTEARLLQQFARAQVETMQGDRHD